MNKKIMIQTLILVTLATVFVSCSNTDTPKPEVKKTEKKQIKKSKKTEKKTQKQTTIKSEEKIPKMLPANYLFEGDYIKIHSPNSAGWSVVNKAESKVVMGKNSDKGRYIAEVVFFSIFTIGKKNFFNFIQRETSKINSDQRYTVVSSEFKETDKRNYPCVISKQLLKDKKEIGTDILITQIKSLYCKDPKNESIGFMVGYSFRGQEIIKDMDKQADSFIDGVQFP